MRYLSSLLVTLVTAKRLHFNRSIRQAPADDITPPADLTPTGVDAALLPEGDAIAPKNRISAPDTDFVKSKVSKDYRKPRHVSLQIPDEKDAPVNLDNEFPEERVYLHSLMNCAGKSAMFSSAASAFYADFQPYVKNTHSVAVCGRTQLWYYSTWVSSYFDNLVR